MSAIKRCGHGGEKRTFLVQATAVNGPASQTLHGTAARLQITRPSSLAPTSLDELPEDSQGTAVLNPYFPKNRRGKTLTQQSNATSYHLTCNITKILSIGKTQVLRRKQIKLEINTIKSITTRKTQLSSNSTVTINWME